MEFWIIQQQQDIKDLTVTKFVIYIRSNFHYQKYHPYLYAEFSNYANDFNAIFTIGRSDSKVNVICIIHVGIKEKKIVNFKDFRAKLIWMWLVIGKLHPNRRNEHIYQILFFLYVSAKLWLIESMSRIQDPYYSCFYIIWSLGWKLKSVHSRSEYLVWHSDLILKVKSTIGSPCLTAADSLTVWVR